MKIEMNKKYKTRNGENVTIHRIAFNKAYGVIECAYKDGLFTVWDMGGELIESEMNGLYDGSLDLVEAKEDWEILIEHFNNNGKPVILVIYGKVRICENMKESEYSSDYCNSLLIMRHDNSYFDLYKKEIRIATLEDCKKYILER